MPGVDPGVFVLTDYGDAISYLVGNGVFVESSSRRRALLESYLAAAGASLHRDAVYTVLQRPEDIPEKLLTFGQCMVRILELAHTTMMPLPLSFHDQVYGHVEQLQVHVVPKMRLKSLLGPKNPVPDFGVAKGGGMTAVKTLSANNAARAQATIDHAVRVFDWVARARSDWRRVAVLDDSIDLWEPQWIEHLGFHGAVFRWNEDKSKIEEYLLATA
jgi:hypothetical protein